VLTGETHRITTPLGTTYVTINANGSEQPFEVFIHTSKAGSDTMAVSEAIGRLISYVLRLSSPVEPRDRMREIVRQLTGIGGGRPLGFGANRVLSLPDGVGQVLQDYLDRGATVADKVQRHTSSAPAPQPAAADRRSLLRMRRSGGRQRGRMPQMLCLRV
jgi:ribonucleoside-diphosphate reductase alpha chain